MKKLLTILLSGITIHCPGIHSSTLDFSMQDDLQDEQPMNVRDQFFLAVGTPETPSIEQYLALGADVNMYSDIARPLHAAALTGNTNIVKELLARGAQVNAKDNMGNTPLFYAVQNVYNNKEMAEQKIQLLIASGADVNVKNTQGASPLHQARTADIAQLLVDAGANLNAKDAQGNTPLMSFANLERIEWFVEQGADINARNNAGNTLLHKIAKFANASNAPLIRTLIEELNADATAQNDQGETPLNAAYAQLQFLQTYNMRNYLLEQNIIENMQALITSVSQKEIQHIIPAIIALADQKAKQPW